MSVLISVTLGILDKSPRTEAAQPPQCMLGTFRLTILTPARVSVTNSTSDGLPHHELTEESPEQPNDASRRQADKIDALLILIFLRWCVSPQGSRFDKWAFLLIHGQKPTVWGSGAVRDERV